jgi:predicted DsbA family dithiol-disulfide isomerase
VRIVFKHFLVHPQAGTIPAHAACAAHKQGKFKQMYNLIWDKGFNAGRNLSLENMETLAKEAGLDMNKFKADMEGDCVRTVRQDQAEMARIGTTGTPAFYINGRFLSGARPVEQFKAIIDEELKKANDRIGKGEATVANYYDEFVIKRGKSKLE